MQTLRVRDTCALPTILHTPYLPLFHQSLPQVAADPEILHDPSPSTIEHTLPFSFCSSLHQDFVLLSRIYRSSDCI